MGRPPQKPRQRNGGSGMGEFYRLSRMLHAYLSAFAFLALIFFSVTGLTLNHPDWLAGREPAEQTRTVRVPPAEVQQALRAPSPPRALAAAVDRVTPLIGDYASGDVLDGEALLRLQGPRGVSDVTLRLATGEAEVTTKRATTIAMLNDLHKGKSSGAGWRLLIDISAVLIILLSVLGYVLFFSLRFRLPLALALTGVSLVAMVGGYLLLIG